MEVQNTRYSGCNQFQFQDQFCGYDTTHSNQSQVFQHQRVHRHLRPTGAQTWFLHMSSTSSDWRESSWKFQLPSSGNYLAWTLKTNQRPINVGKTAFERLHSVASTQSRFSGGKSTSQVVMSTIRREERTTSSQLDAASYEENYVHQKCQVLTYWFYFESHSAKHS